MRKLLLISAFLIASATTIANGNSKLNPFIDVQRYGFSLELSDSSDTIFGRTIISMVLLHETDSLCFDLRNLRDDGKGMIVKEVLLNSGKVGWKHSGDKISVFRPGTLKVGEEITVTISYSGIPADGLLISQNKFGNRSFFADHWPDRASYYLPCIDHVADKAAVEFKITAPLHYKVVSNGTLIEESNLTNNRKLTHWREDIPIPVKVMTFGAAEFATNFVGIAAGVPVWTYVYPENREAGFSDYALALSPVEYYSTLVGPYPFPKLANVQSKTVFGGLENAGSIFYSENSVTGTGRSEGLIAHEIAHQWFGNSVTERDWHHVWLSEGFATYLTTLYWENKQGSDRLISDMKSARERVLRSSAQSPKPVIDTTIVNLMGLLSANSYQKGAWVLHMLRNELGNEVFVKGLQLYYRRFQNSNALTGDFRVVMEEVSGRNLEQFFHQWLYIAGQPDLKTEWVYNSGNGNIDITISQTQDHLFRFPLEVQIGDGSGSKRIKMEIKDRVTKVSLKVSGNPIVVVSDPDVVLLFREVK